MTEALWQSDLPGCRRRGGARCGTCTNMGDALLIVASDRLSAYDHVLRPGFRGKGKILNQLSNFWFGHLAAVVPNHLLATEPEDFPASLAPYREILRGRSVLARKARVVPFECVARGLLAGSGFREYERQGTVCGISLPAGLRRASRLPHPLFTPATKAETGHDENVDFETVDRALGPELAANLRDLTLKLYNHGGELAAAQNLLLADTKFEFGHALDSGELLLHRRGPHPRLLPLLGRRALGPRRRAGLLRQAVRPKLARRVGLGQGIAAPGVAGRGGEGTLDAISRPFADHRTGAGVVGW